MSSGLPHQFSRNVLAAALLSCALPVLGQDALEDQGKKIVDATCNSCHAIGARTGSGYTPEGWDSVLRMMQNLPGSPARLQPGLKVNI